MLHPEESKLPPRIRLESLDLGYFDGRTIYDHVTECLIWTGASTAGYGYLGIEQRNFYAHRLAFFLKWGYWPKEAMHSCDRKLCVAWWHLSDGTRAQNTKDAYARGRRLPKTPEQMHTVRLTRDNVREMRRIRTEDGLTYREIGERFGVAERTSQAACTGVTWKCVI
jgi:hypothetical protein